MSAQLFHYTCAHSQERLLAMGDRAVILPGRELTPTKTGPVSRVAWFTDLALPKRDALGLTMNFISCDRTEFRWKVTDPHGIVRWSEVRDTFGEAALELEESPGAESRHWFVSYGPVKVEYAPTVLIRMGSHWSERGA